MNFLKNISHSTATDPELVALFKQTGEVQVLATLYQRYMDLVYGVCLKYFKEPERAKDAVMSIFEELITKLKKHDVKQFRGWLYAVARTHCLMQLRAGRQLKTDQLDVELVQSAEEMHLERVFEKEMELERLGRCLDALAADQKWTVELFYLQGKCYHEIVALSGMDWNKVRSLIQNGRRNLKICMEKTIHTLRSDE